MRSILRRMSRDKALASGRITNLSRVVAVRCPFLIAFKIQITAHNVG